MVNEIGGYIELDRYQLPMRHDKAIALNCGRSALEYICQARDIKKIWLPYFLCDSVFDRLHRCGIEVEFYPINDVFLPKCENKLLKNEYIYIVNYYGFFDKNVILELKLKYENIIIDNSQAYYHDPVDKIDTFYTCRKFFGVPDGAFLYTDASALKISEQDESFDRMNYLLGRFERSAGEFYPEYVQRNKSFADESVKRMSRLTDNLLHGIHYESVKQIRDANYSYLSERLDDRNELNAAKVPIGPFAYPFLIKNGRQLRQMLIEHKIYVPLLWPGVLTTCSPDTWEYRLAADLLPLPVDQRYGKEEMQQIVDVLFDCLSEI